MKKNERSFFLFAVYGIRTDDRLFNGVWMIEANVKKETRVTGFIKK